MSRLGLAGAASFVTAPILAIASVLVATTMSDDPAPQVAAYADHHSSMVAATVLQTVAIVLFLAGIVWLATTLAPRARGLAVAGGILGVAGSLIILLEDGLEAALPSVVSALDPALATKVVDQIHSSTVAGLEPLSTLQPIGGLLLAVAAVKAGVPRWASALFAVGGFVDTAGFATGTKAVVAVGFVVMLSGLLPLIRSFAGPAPVAMPAAQPAT